MKTHIFTATCSVCGEDGAATIQTAAASWYSDTIISHEDPRVCEENIHYKELRKREAKNASIKVLKELVNGSGTE